MGQQPFSALMQQQQNSAQQQHNQFGAVQQINNQPSNTNNAQVQQFQQPLGLGSIESSFMANNPGTGSSFGPTGGRKSTSNVTMGNAPGPYSSNANRAVAMPIQRMGAGTGGTLPIRELSCYSARWTIKARVTSRGETRTYRNAKGEGKFFN